MRVLYFFSVWLHILAAAVWIGGMVFLAVVLVPMIRRPEYRGIAATVVQHTGARSRWIGWLSLGTLLITGLFNLAYRGWLGGGFAGVVLGMKLLLVVAIFVLSALHDFSIGPHAIAQWQENPGSAGGMRLRRQASWIGRLNLFLGLIVVALGVMLVRGVPW